MNMMLNEEFAKAEQANASETDASKNPALARMMKAWESKQAKNARKATGFGLVAVSLAACGGSSSDDSDDSDPDPVDPIGEVFTLTIGDDNITGTAGDDTFNAPLASAEGSLTGVLGLQTLGDTDVIDGGEGVDTLNAVLNGTGLAIFDFAAPEISNVEVYNLTSRNDAGGLDLSNSTGYEQLWNVNSVGDLRLVNVGESAAIGLNGTAGDTTYRVDYTSSADVSEQVVIANAVGGSTLSGLVTNLRITDPTGSGIEDLSLVVSNGVRLQLQSSAANIENLEIEGSGNLVLSGTNNFQNLLSLDSTGYNDDLTLNVSGSSDLESVLTGSGDDLVIVLDQAVNGGLSVDMNGGNDILAIVTNPTFDTADINALDFTGGVANVENLAFVNEVILDSIDDEGATVLNLDGFDGALETIWFVEGFDGYENWSVTDQTSFTLANAPEVLTINAFNPFEDPAVGQKFWAANLGTGDIKDLTINAPDAVDIYGLNAPNLENLTINQTGVEGGMNYASFWVLSSDSNESLGDDTTSLQNLSVSGDWSQIIIDVSGDGNDADALETISLSAADTGNEAGSTHDAYLNLIGAESEIPAAEQAVVAAEADLDQAQQDRDDALIARANAEDDVDAAQADVDAAQADVDAAQADVDAAQIAFDDAEAELAAAQEQSDDAVELVQEFIPPNTGALQSTRDANEAALKNYINSTSLPAGLKADLIADLDGPGEPVPGGGAVTGFTASNINAWLADEVPGIVEAFFDIAGLEAAEAAAEIVLTDAETVLADAQTVLTDAQTVLTDAQTVLADAEAALTAAQTAFSDAEIALSDAQQNLADAQAALAAAEGGTGFESLTMVSVDADDFAIVDLENVYGAFDLEVTAGQDAFVGLTDTNVQTISVSAGTNVEYDLNNDGDIIGFEEIDTAFVALGEDNFGNPNLESLVVSGAGAEVSLSGDLFSLNTIDLTGVTEQFTVDASGADFAPAAGDYVTYLIGGTSSDWAEGYSFIDAAGAREAFKFTEADFGTIVIDGFNAGADPMISDRLDLSDLGYTGNIAELIREQGTFDENTGEFTVDGGADVRITDLAGGSTDFSGEIILMNVDADDLVGNIL
jgi:multidrug efflux pump subunit AcrA (membrane-fusion protein)